jgi:hypothetical protein
MNARTATVAQIEAEAARFQAEVGDRFIVNPNGYGVHIRCVACGEFSTHDRAYRFSREHVCADELNAAQFTPTTGAEEFDGAGVLHNGVAEYTECDVPEVAHPGFPCRHPQSNCTHPSFFRRGEDIGRDIDGRQQIAWWCGGCGDELEIEAR